MRKRVCGQELKDDASGVMRVGEKSKKCCIVAKQLQVGEVDGKYWGEEGVCRSIFDGFVVASNEVGARGSQRNKAPRLKLPCLLIGQRIHGHRVGCIFSRTANIDTHLMRLERWTNDVSSSFMYAHRIRSVVVSLN